MDKLKTLNIRLPKEMWVILKKLSIEKEKSMNAIIIDSLEKYKKNYEKRIDNK